MLRKIEVTSKPEIAWLLSGMGRVTICNRDPERAGFYLEQALELYRKMGQQASVVYTSECLGWCASLRGDIPKAYSLYNKCLQWVTRSERKADISECLIYIGHLLGSQGSPEKFARSIGAAERLTPEIHKYLNVFLRSDTEKSILTTRALLGDEAYNAAQEAGRQMSLEQALASASSELKQGYSATLNE